MEMAQLLPLNYMYIYLSYREWVHYESKRLSLFIFFFYFSLIFTSILLFGIGCISKGRESAPRGAIFPLKVRNKEVIKIFPLVKMTKRA